MNDERGIAGKGDGNIVLRLWNTVVDGLAALGTLMIVALMVMICSDVVARNAAGSSLPLISELGALTVVMIVFLQLGTAVRNERLASSDFAMLAIGSRAPRAASALSALWSLVGFAACAAIAWSTFGILQRDMNSGEFIGIPGVMTMKTWPFRALILVGSIVATIQFVIQASRHAISALKAPEGRHDGN